MNTNITRIERRVERILSERMHHYGVEWLINQQCEPTREEIEESDDMDLGILNQDIWIPTKVSAYQDIHHRLNNIELEINLPSEVEIEANNLRIVSPMQHGNVDLSERDYKIIDARISEFLDNIVVNLQNHEHRNIANFRETRNGKFKYHRANVIREANYLEQLKAREEAERRLKEDEKRRKEEDIWITETVDLELRLADPLVAAF